MKLLRVVAAVLLSFIFLSRAAVSFGSEPISWLDSQMKADVVYLLFASPPRIERYDVNSETWLTTINLPETPHAFAIDADAVYVGYARHVSRFSLDGSGETHLKNTSLDVQTIFVIDDFLIIHYGGANLLSLNKLSGSLVNSREYFRSMQGISVAPANRKIFARDTGLSPSDIIQIPLNPDGTLGSQTESPYHGDYPSASRTFIFPGEARVADDSGTIYNTADLTYSNSLAGAIDDLAFYYDLPVVRRGNSLISYSNAFLETGRYTADQPLGKIYVRGEFIYSFAADLNALQKVAVSKMPISVITPAAPGTPVNPEGLAYTPKEVIPGKDGIVYLLSAAHLSVFRWSTLSRTYLETIPLLEAPSHMAYSADLHRLYLAYPTGKITKIDLDISVSEQPFANSPQKPLDLATAGEYLFVSDETGPWVSHFTYSKEGVLISMEDWNYYSSEYIWNAANRKMYFFRDDTSPNDLLWEDIDVNGIIGRYQDTPYHGGYGWLHPIRVAPDGSIVVLGSGIIYDAKSLQEIDALSNNINDAAWHQGILFTMRDYSGKAQLQKWGSNYGVAVSREVNGTPVRIFSLDEGLLLITTLNNIPYFSVWDINLDNVYQQNTPPELNVLTPNAGSTYCKYTPLSFEANASDIEDGYLSNIIEWSSSIDGYLGQGGKLRQAISAGTHLITAKIQDSNNAANTKAVDNITVSPPELGDINRDCVANLPDVISALQVISGITSPAPTYAEGDINDDGVIGAAEAIYVLRKLAGL